MLAQARRRSLASFDFEARFKMSAHAMRRSRTSFDFKARIKPPPIDSPEVRSTAPSARQKPTLLDEAAKATHRARNSPIIEAPKLAALCAAAVAAPLIDAAVVPAAAVAEAPAATAAEAVDAANAAGVAAIAVLAPAALEATASAVPVALKCAWPS